MPLLDLWVVKPTCFCKFYGYTGYKNSALIYIYTSSFFGFGFSISITFRTSGAPYFVHAIVSMPFLAPHISSLKPHLLTKVAVTLTPPAAPLMPKIKIVAIFSQSFVFASLTISLRSRSYSS